MAMQICAFISRESSKQIPLFRHMTKAKKHTGMQLVVDSAKTSAISQPSLAKELHASAKVLYPEAKQIPLPDNVDEIDSSKLACFSPQRSRDILGSVMSTQMSAIAEAGPYMGSNQQPSSDPHVVSYDCHGAVSLNSVMQSNVPEPFSSNGKSTHLNMPGGQWGQGQKYIAEDLQNSHYSKVPRQDHGGKWKAE